MRALGTGRIALGLVLSTLAGASLPAVAQIEVLELVVSDNGDGDGFADTRETVDLRLRVRNVSGTALTGVVAEMITSNVNVCVTQPTLAIGSLGVDEERVTGDAFTLVVADVQRTTTWCDSADTGEFSPSIEIGLSADQIASFVTTTRLELDVDVTHGAGADTYLESFESGSLGTFEPMNLDAGMPGNSDAEGLANADGWRCQDSDPDWVNSGSHGDAEAGLCYPGLNLPNSNAFHWQVDGATNLASPDGGRAHTGGHSLYFGVFLTNPPGSFTTPIGTIEAVGMSVPINLGWTAPELAFDHQISLVDDRALGAVPPLRSADRGVVQLQFADDSMNPVGHWLKLEPFKNEYDESAVDNYYYCKFDPIDDGNTEDDFFDPDDPDRRLGPSSTCYPELTWGHLGDTDEPFTPGNIGNASSGPGTAGSLGVGTWVDSRVDLSRWRGCRIRLRFLTSTVQHHWENWEILLAMNPDPRDDGWWIDDITVSDTLQSPASILVDAKDNSALPDPVGPDADGDGRLDVCDVCVDVWDPGQSDLDFDGTGDACDACPTNPQPLEDHDGDLLCGLEDNCAFADNPDQTDTDGDAAGDACDCAALDPTTYPGAAEIHDGLDNQCPGDPGYGVIDEVGPTSVFVGPDEYAWSVQPGAGRYQVARATSADFVSGCVAYQPSANTSVTDGDPVAPGTVHHYLVRVTHPDAGSWGQDSAEVERTVSCAPP